jgi:DNA polymerase-3 subunit gamma/tau
MSEVLYRKYRPQNFEQVVGQNSVVSALQKSIKNNKLSHSYLFVGSRGIGKTSIARIFAKEIDTHQDDIYELDAASNRGIDEVRALREAVNTLPFHSKYKVYIIDEVHMLTKEAFNALLKTLEEPPAHIIFILATTELHKIPETIISRCELYQFQKPDMKVLADQVENVAKQEKYKISRQSAEFVALAGDNSFRNTLTVLQKVIGGSKDKELSDEEIRQVVGIPSQQFVHNFLDAFETKSTDEALLAISELKNSGLSVSRFLEIILKTMRQILLVRFAKTLHEQIKQEVGADEFAYIETKAKNSKSGINSAVLTELIKVLESIGVSSIPELPLELAIIELFKNDK